jgi:hypothetical protein
MPLKEVVKIGEKEVTVQELTVREIYDADVSPPKDKSLIPLYMALGLDYPLVLAATGMPPEELIGIYPSDLDRITEAFRKANPFLEKPMVKEGREHQAKMLVNSYSELFAVSLQQAMDQVSGTTP